MKLDDRPVTAPRPAVPTADTAAAANADADATRNAAPFVRPEDAAPPLRARARRSEPPMPPSPSPSPSPPSPSPSPPPSSSVRPRDAEIVRTQPSDAAVARARERFPDIARIRTGRAQDEAYRMLARADEPPVSIGGLSAQRFLHDAIVGNALVSDRQVLAMADAPFSRLARTPEERADIESRAPGSRALPSHQMAVAMLSSLTGIPRGTMSAWGPDLGLMGTPSTFLAVPHGVRDQFRNALHDTTDFLRDAGVDGLNRAVWNTENSTLSALRSFLGV